MYVVVRYGDHQEQIFNPNCRTTTFLKSIRDKCLDCDQEDIELSDESGNIKFLREAHDRYASELLEERERLVLLRVEGSESSSPRYTPLLQDEDAITEEFLARLVVKDEVDSRPSSWRARSTNRKPQQDKDAAKVNKDKVNKDKVRQVKQEKPVRSRSRQAKEP